MRISLLCTTDSFTKIQALLAIQPLANRASVARQAFELDLRTLVAEADEEDSDLVHAPKDDTGKTEPAPPLLAEQEPDEPNDDEPTLASTLAAIASRPPPPEPAQPLPDLPNWPPLELLVEDESDEDRELAELLDSL